MHPAASSSWSLCSTWIARVPCTLHNTHKSSSAVTVSQANMGAVRESVAASPQKILTPPFTGVGTLSHSSPCRCLFTPRRYYVREKLQLSNHNEQRACGRESQLLWTVAVTFLGDLRRLNSLGYTGHRSWKKNTIFKQNILLWITFFLIQIQQ